MDSYSINQIKDIVIHRVGNKTNEEGVEFSKHILALNDSIKAMLLNYFLNPFKEDKYYTFYHETDIKYNEVFSYVSEIFSNFQDFYTQSLNLATLLYKYSVHPRTKKGEFYVVYFRDCRFDNHTVDAVGLFKSENKETFLKVYSTNSGFEIASDEGIDINKLDKGCLIFNTKEDKGYIVQVIDNLSRGVGAQYWIEDFLQVKPRNDNFHSTENILSVYRNFISQELPQKLNISKKDQLEYINKGLEYFRENNHFNLEGFVNDVIVEPDLINIFSEYKLKFEDDKNLKISNDFIIVDDVVKKQTKSFKRMINLDDNVQITIKANKNKIEQGQDEFGRNYYKIYYEKEV